jgi:hypothetical protein
MLIDFRLDPTRIDEALNDHLPSAGRIAKKIAGHFQDLREYLNGMHLIFQSARKR